MASTVGFGGAFIRASDPEALYAWYEEHLGIARTNGYFEFPPESLRAQIVFTFVARSDDYFPTTQPVMVNLQVDDLDAVLDRLTAEGVAVDPERPAYDFGKFGWITDPEGNRIELWQPISDE